MTVAYLPFAMILCITKSNVEFMAAPLTFALTLQLPWRDSFTPSQITNAWKDAFIRAGDYDTNKDTVIVYLSADSQERFEAWRNFLEHKSTPKLMGMDRMNIAARIA